LEKGLRGRYATQKDRYGVLQEDRLGRSRQQEA
jgi:hypothetical protein